MHSFGLGFLVSARHLNLIFVRNIYSLGSFVSLRDIIVCFFLPPLRHLYLSTRHLSFVSTQAIEGLDFVGPSQDMLDFCQAILLLTLLFLYETDMLGFCPRHLCLHFVDMVFETSLNISPDIYGLGFVVPLRDIFAKT